MTSKTIRLHPPHVDYEIRIVGARATPLRDFYHALLRHGWTVTFGAITGVFLVANVLFALAYLLTGGISHARPGSFSDAFFFSVQTIATIGYGAMYPETQTANGLVVAESIVGLTLTALTTGLVFAKFSRPTARVMFSRLAVISPMNGVPTLMFRIGNERSNEIIDAQIRLALVRTERTSEGKTFYRMLDLTLARDRALSLSRSWTAFHVIDRESPLGSSTPESLVRDEAELQVLVVGFDDVTMQPVHASHRYSADNIIWGAGLSDVLSEAPDGALVLDLTKFHHIESAAPTADFPYSREA